MSNKIIDEARKKLVLMGYSKNTKKTYLYYLRFFCEHFKSKDINKLIAKDIESYFYSLNQKNHLSYSAQLQYINAIKFYFEKVKDNLKTIYKLPRPRKPKKLPQVISRNEIKTTINALPNIKHKAILHIIYSSGLRLGELLNLKIIDIDSNTMLINITGNKGKYETRLLL